MASRSPWPPDGEALLKAAGVPANSDGVTVAEAAQLSTRLMAGLGRHRFPRRVSVLRPS
jgi:catalase